MSAGTTTSDDPAVLMTMLAARESALETEWSELETSRAAVESRQGEIADQLDKVRGLLAVMRTGGSVSTSTTPTRVSRTSNSRRAAPAAGRRPASNHANRGRTSKDTTRFIDSAMTHLAEHVQIAAGPSFYLRELIRLNGDGEGQSVTARQIARRGPDGKVSGPESATASTNLRRLAEKGLIERIDDERPARYRLSRQAKEWIAVT